MTEHGIPQFLSRDNSVYLAFSHGPELLSKADLVNHQDCRGSCRRALPAPRQLRCLLMLRLFRPPASLPH